MKGNIRILVIDGGEYLPTSMRLGMMGALALSKTMNGIELPPRLPKGKGERKKNRQERWN